MGFRGVALVCILMFGCLPYSVRAEDTIPSGPKAPRSMLICYLTNSTEYQSRSAGAAVARMLRYRASNLPQLSNLPPLNVVERVIEQEGLSPHLSLQLSTALKVARISGQEWVVMGSVKRRGDILQFRVEIRGAATGNLIGKPLTASGKLQDLGVVERDLARDLLGGIGLQLTEVQQSELSKPLTSSHMAIRYLGDHLLSSGKTASSFLDKSLTADPKFPVAGVHRAARALENGRYNDAVMISREWRRRLPENRDFASCEFGALLSSGRLADADNLLDSIDANYPNSFSLTLLRYWLCRLQSDQEGSVQAATRLVTMNPASAEAHARACASNLERAIHSGGELFLSQMTPEQAGNFASAIDASVRAGEAACELDPKYQQVWLYLMTAYREKGEYHKCKQAFQRLIALSSGHWEARMSLALTHLCQNRVAPARALLEVLAKATPDDPQVFLGLSICCSKEGDDSSARLLRDRALSMDAGCTDLKYLRLERHWPVELFHQARVLNPSVARKINATKWM